MINQHALVPARIATSDDIDAVVATLTTAFFDDPVWGPAFPDVDHRASQAAALWRLLVTSAMRYPWTLVTENVESAAIWLPPDGVELTDDEADELEDFLIDTTNRTVANGIVAILEQLASARPREPHFFLSLLATHDQHRGRGLGMGLLRENLARTDALGAATYLESTNPANNKRYTSVGFTARDEITTPSGHIVTTMWRAAR
jgi:GNAT superfamily N-acetyltransferase